MKKRVLIAAATLLILTAAALPGKTAEKIDWPPPQELQHSLLHSTDSRKPLTEAGLSAPEIEAVRRVLTDLENRACSNDQIPACYASESEVVGKVPITTDGQTAVVLLDAKACGTAGCPIWIVQVAHGGSLLLEDFGRGYAILPSHEHGYFHVVTAAGNHDADLVMLRFTGKRYQPFRCAVMEQINAGGELRISDRPCPVSAN
jgi:hypothetical protein